MQLTPKDLTVGEKVTVFKLCHADFDNADYIHKTLATVIDLTPTIITVQVNEPIFEHIDITVLSFKRVKYFPCSATAKTASLANHEAYINLYDQSEYNDELKQNQIEMEKLLHRFRCCNAQQQSSILSQLNESLHEFNN